MLVIHKPHFLFIVEPKISIYKLPNHWFLKLGFKKFASNNTPLPSFWCLCKIDVMPTVLDSSNQFIVSSFYLDNRLLETTTPLHEWLSTSTTSSICAFTKLHSDHYPILLNFIINPIKVISQFRFLKTWTLHHECNNIIESSYKHKVVGCSMIVLCRKLHMLKKDLKIWNHTILGNVT